MNIIDFGSIKLQRKISSHGFCHHNSLSYDVMNKTIECGDCGAFVDPFNAFMIIAQNIDRAYEKLNRDVSKFREDKQKEISLIAAKKAETAWRSKTMIPACPHCNEAIFPQDNFGGTMLNKEMAIQRRKFKRK